MREGEEVSKQSLEGLLREVGWRLAEYEVARIYKIPEEFHTTPCDFMGFTAGGRAILIEAKQVQRMSLPIGTSNGLQVHQWNALEEASRANCISLICWANGDEVATIDFDQAATYSEGRKSIPWRAIPERYIHELYGDPFRLLEPWLSRATERS